MKDPIVKWQDNYGAELPPPGDAEEWVTIARELKPDAPTVVRFVTHDQRAWIVAEASRSRVHVGPGPWEMGPIQMEDALKAALRAAGKPVAD